MSPPQWRRILRSKNRSYSTLPTILGQQGQFALIFFCSPFTVVIVCRVPKFIYFLVAVQSWYSVVSACITLTHPTSSKSSGFIVWLLSWIKEGHCGDYWVHSWKSFPYKSSQLIFLRFELPLNFIFHCYRTQTWQFTFFFLLLPFLITKCQVLNIRGTWPFVAKDLMYWLASPQVPSCTSSPIRAV